MNFVLPSRLRFILPGVAGQMPPSQLWSVLLLILIAFTDRNASIVKLFYPPLANRRWPAAKRRQLDHSNSRWLLVAGHLRWACEIRWRPFHSFRPESYPHSKAAGSRACSKIVKDTFGSVTKRVKSSVINKGVSKRSRFLQAGKARKSSLFAKMTWAISGSVSDEGLMSRLRDGLLLSASRRHGVGTGRRCQRCCRPYLDRATRGTFETAA